MWGSARWPGEEAPAEPPPPLLGWWPLPDSPLPCDSGDECLGDWGAAAAGCAQNAWPLDGEARGREGGWPEGAGGGW